MMKFIETIKIVDGVVENFEYHKRRFSITFSYHFNSRDIPDFTSYVENILMIERERISKGIFKLRIVYSGEVLIYSVDLYSPRVIKTLKLVEDNGIDYSFKYENRSQIERLLKLKGDCDDIIIVKNGELTDTSFCNIVFERNGSFFTPSNYLLAGTNRERKIEEGLLKEERIRPCDIRRYNKVYIINSMLDLYPIERIEL